MRKLGWKLVSFSGPSISPAEAARRTGGVALPPAQQGDIFRILPRQPRAIALIDGVFETVPSVWHRELLAALDAGVMVFGASSMGALRAAELGPYGMVGVGTVFDWVRKGRVKDDSDVALRHAEGNRDYRGVTVPLVTVWHAVDEARRRRLLTPKQARAVLAAAEALHYQERSWPEVLGGLDAKVREQVRALPDVKQEDAKLCLAAASEYARSDAPPPSGPRAKLPSHVRRRRIEQTPSWIGERPIDPWAVLELLDEDEGKRAYRSRVLAAWGGSLGMAASESELVSERRQWMAEIGLTPKTLPRFLAESALDEGSLRELLAARIVEWKVLEHAERLLPDAPSYFEAIAGEAKLSGNWARLAREVDRQMQRGPRRRS